MVFGDKVYRNTYNNVFVVRDGLIVEAREYMDPGATAEGFS
jgi:ketosteroid isomerase-like protein